MTYEEKIAELFERHRSVQSSGFSADAYKPGLSAMRRLDAYLGHPSEAFASIHVAGTNGKGSVCTMLSASLARAAITPAPGGASGVSGTGIGLYTSPHLLDFRERMKIISGNSFEMISRQEVCEFLDKYADALEGLTFFEVTTGMAFWWFAKRGVATAVIETGLGGRLDSTNIVRPAISVITSIGLDHCELLGNTRELIAAEKAGIFKPGVPAVVWGRDSQTSPVFEAAASRSGARLHFADGSSNEATVELVLSLLGCPQSFVPLEEASRITGFRGRWERIGPVILDIGHNPQALERNFVRLVAEDAAGAKAADTGTGDALGRGSASPIIVYGVMADKDYRAVARLFPSCARIILTCASTPRSLPLHDLEEAVHCERPELETVSAPTVAEAVSRAFELAGNSKDASEPGVNSCRHLIYVGGSTYVVSDALSFLENGAIA